MVKATERDAQEYGLHVKQGGWRLGLLVARNVEKAQHGGDRKSNQVSSETRSGKVNATAFAKSSGTSAKRVLQYLAAWEAAAEAGHVPSPARLKPGQDVHLDAEKLPDWSDFYPPMTGGYNGSPERTPTVKGAREMLSKLPTAERAAVVAEAVAGSIEVAEAVAGDAVANARVSVATANRRTEAARTTRQQTFREEEGSEGWAVARVGSRIGELRGSVRALVITYQEVMAANPGNEELRKILLDDINGAKTDLIIALDTLAGEGVDAALNRMLMSEEEAR